MGSSPRDDGRTAAIRIERLPDGSPRADGAHDAGGSHDATRPSVDLAMTAHDRRRVRRRVVAPDGRVFELALPTGTALAVGAVLHEGDDAVYRITAAEERVIEVRPRTLAEAAFVGHTIGNLHRDVDLVGDVILALWDAPLERRLRAAGVPIETVERPFRGRAPGEHAHG